MLGDPQPDAREEVPDLGLSWNPRYRDIRVRGGRVLAVDDPLPARRLPDRADPRSGLVVKPSPVVHGELLLAAERACHRLLHTLGLERVDLLFFDRRAHAGDSAINPNI